MKSSFFKKILLLAITFLFIPSAFAELEEVLPPKENPHPAVTEADKKRVAFAEEAIALFLREPLPKKWAKQKPSTVAFTAVGSSQNKDLVCMKKVACYGKEKRFIEELAWIHQLRGTIVEVRHSHVVPWAFRQFQQHQSNLKPQSKEAHRPDSASTGPASSIDTRSAAEGQDEARPIGRVIPLGPDEYVVHSYVRFSQDARWYHLDVVMSEDPQGHLVLRHFNIAEMSLGKMNSLEC